VLNFLRNSQILIRHISLSRTDCFSKHCIRHWLLWSTS